MSIHFTVTESIFSVDLTIIVLFNAQFREKQLREE